MSACPGTYGALRCNLPPLHRFGHVYVATTDDLGDHAGEDVSEQ